MSDSFNTTFSSGERFATSMGENVVVHKFVTSMGENVVVHKGGQPYDGSYEVTPKVEAQSLPTKEKYLKEDVTIHGVPYFETDNEDGTTVYIASEV